MVVSSAVSCVHVRAHLSVRKLLYLPWWWCVCVCRVVCESAGCLRHDETCLLAAAAASAVPDHRCRGVL